MSITAASTPSAFSPIEKERDTCGERKRKSPISIKPIPVKILFSTPQERKPWKILKLTPKMVHSSNLAAMMNVEVNTDLVNKMFVLMSKIKKSKE